MRFDLTRRYKRWRHGRGYGIHSPFAYDFITLTLRERLPYYGYELLAELQPSSSASLSQRRLRLIFRIAVRFNPRSVAVVGSRNKEPVSEAIRIARSDTSIVDSPESAYLTIVTNEARLQSPAEDCVLIFPDTRHGGGAATCERLWSATRCGMRFDNGRGFTVMVLSPKLPRQQFDVRF